MVDGSLESRIGWKEHLKEASLAVIPFYGLARRIYKNICDEDFKAHYRLNSNAITEGVYITTLSLLNINYIIVADTIIKQISK